MSRVSEALTAPNIDGKCLQGFQKVGVVKVAENSRFLLLDEMGLGKSPQWIRAMDAIGARRLLVLCKAIGKEKWANEFRKWQLMPRSVQIINGRRQTEMSTNADVTIINYDIVGDYLDRLQNMRFDAGALDEAQALNNFSAKRTGIVYAKGGIVHSCQRVHVLSGGLARNHPGDLHPHLKVLFGHRMQRAGIPVDYWDFVRRFCVVTAEGKILADKFRDIRPLRDFLKEVSVRRYTKNVLDQLPPQFESVPLRVYEELASLLAIETGDNLEDLRGAFTDDQIVQRLAGWTHEATYRKLCGIALAQPVAEMVKADFDEGMGKVAIFFHHRMVGERLCELLAEFNPILIYGGTSDTFGKLQRFDRDPACRVALGQIQSVSTSIDMPAADTVVFAEYEWVDEDNKQALKRVDRPLAGQKKSVRVKFPYIVGTIHEAITKTRLRKTEALQQLY